MAHPGWYPPGQVCYPPELPASFKNIHELKPIVGVPSDDEVIGIHTVMHAASRVSGVTGMHDPNFFMQLADHLFNAQMARYRSKYSLITFPSDATYVPPALPAHISAGLEPIVGAPSDDEITKVYDAIQIYQELKRIPSLFDARTNMELSQHLFNLQMARHMQTSGENKPRLISQITVGPVSSVQTAEVTQQCSSGDSTTTTNNMGTGANVADTHHTTQQTTGIDVREVMERSNQLAERLNQLLEHSNEIAERCSQPADQPSIRTLAERFDQVLERLAQVVEHTHQPTEQSDRMAERFNQIFERLNQLAEQSAQRTQSANELAERSNESVDRANKLTEQLNQSHARFNQLFEHLNQLIEQSIQHTQRANELAQRSNDSADRANKIAEQLNQYHKRSNQHFERLNQLVDQSTQSTQRTNEIAQRSRSQANDSADQANKLTEQPNQSYAKSNLLSEQANQTWEQVKDVLGNVNKVLVKIQHAIVRNHRGNTISALNALVNEKGNPPEVGGLPYIDLRQQPVVAEQTYDPNSHLRVIINGNVHQAYLHDDWLGRYLRFYGIDCGLSMDQTTTALKAGKEADARERLSRYLPSCLA
ncbi:unnamed protein product [Rhizoctonia solani]|uniref:Laminin domain protein n=1 Tax=Rhizoctonia solani TaxID=456999 RepID=A0A8H3H509_9AGAM|nr:unnamed protein product [Rhizoctonia solani]CAE7102760.1 unnamed protein product [Rhizoctonia solani]